MIIIKLTKIFFIATIEGAIEYLAKKRNIPPAGYNDKRLHEKPIPRLSDDETDDDISFEEIIIPASARNLPNVSSQSGRDQPGTSAQNIDEISFEEIIIPANTTNPLNVSSENGNRDQADTSAENIAFSLNLSNPTPERGEPENHETVSTKSSESNQCNLNDQIEPNEETNSMNGSLDNESQIQNDSSRIDTRQVGMTNTSQNNPSNVSVNSSGIQTVSTDLIATLNPNRSSIDIGSPESSNTNRDNEVVEVSEQNEPDNQTVSMNALETSSQQNQGNLNATPFDVYSPNSFYADNDEEIIATSEQGEPENQGTDSTESLETTFEANQSVHINLNAVQSSDTPADVKPNVVPMYEVYKGNNNDLLLQLEDKIVEIVDDMEITITSKGFGKPLNVTEEGFIKSEIPDEISGNIPFMKTVS